MGSFRGERGGGEEAVCAGACVLVESVRQVRQARVSWLPGAVCAATLAVASGHQDGRAGSPRHLSAAGAGMRYW